MAVTCSAAGPDPAIVVYLGDGNDFAESINDRAVGHSVTFYGEDGDDDLDSDGSADVLDGGAGNDLLTPDDDAAGPGDVVRGGPGIDTLQTGNPTGALGPITVAFDDLANDGYPGEGDNYASDLENSRPRRPRRRSTSPATTARTTCSCAARPRTSCAAWAATTASTAPTATTNSTAAPATTRSSAEAATT